MIADLSFMFFICCWLAFVQPQSAQRLERDIVPEEFIKSRPAKPGATASRRISYRGANRKHDGKTASAPSTQLGLTIWRLRQAAASDSGERIIVQEEGEIVEWIPERVEAGVPLRVGEKIRLSFESQQTGYLYLVNRELYADGAIGEPWLIFPAARTRQGDNQVAAGKLIEIPAQEDRPNFFTMRRGRLDQIGEQLIVITTPQPLADLAIGVKPLKLTDEQVTRWEQNWSAKAERFELAGGSGKPWTRVERETGADAARQLTQDDPGPQTIFRLAVGPSQPRLIKITLRYAAPKPQRRNSSRRN